MDVALPKWRNLQSNKTIFSAHETLKHKMLQLSTMSTLEVITEWSE